ncbi:unnamed protein product [Penicillium bialowiezense]
MTPLVCLKRSLDFKIIYQFDETDLEDLLEACYESKTGSLTLSRCAFCDEDDQPTRDTDDLFSHVAQHLLSFSRISLEGYSEEIDGTSDTSGAPDETTSYEAQMMTGTIKEGLEADLQDFTGDECDDRDSLSTVLALELPLETEDEQWNFYWQTREVPDYDQTTDLTLNPFMGSLENVQVEVPSNGYNWAQYYDVPKEVTSNMSNREIARQNILHEILFTEYGYLDQLAVVGTLYRDKLIQVHPPILSTQHKMDFVEQAFGGIGAVEAVNREFMFKSLLDCQRRQRPFIIGVGKIFCDWIVKARQVYVDYSAAYPKAKDMIRKEAASNPQFDQFLRQAREHKDSQRLAWDTYLKSPIERVSRYLLLLRAARRKTAEDNEDLYDLIQAITHLEVLQADCGKVIESKQKRLELLELIPHLYFDPSVEMDGVEFYRGLRERSREILFQGTLRRRETLKALERLTKEPWTDIHAILLDSHLLLTTPITKAKPKRRFSFLANRSPASEVKEYEISEAPIPIHLLGLELDIDAHRPTLIPQVPDNKKAPPNPLKIRHFGKNKVHALYALSSQDYSNWAQKIIQAKTQYASSLISLNKEPYRLNLILGTEFKYTRDQPSSRVALAPGTALDRAMKDAHTRSLQRTSSYLRVHSSNVNCAVTINLKGLLDILMIGTDDGVLIFGPDSTSRGSTQILRGYKVTQIHVFEEHGIMIFLADTKLFARELHGLGLPFEVFAPETVASFTNRIPLLVSERGKVNIVTVGHDNGKPMLIYRIGSSPYVLTVVDAPEDNVDTIPATDVLWGDEQVVLGRHCFKNSWQAWTEHFNTRLIIDPRLVKTSHIGSLLIRMTPELIEKTSLSSPFEDKDSDLSTVQSSGTCDVASLVGDDIPPIGMFELTDRHSRFSGHQYVAVYQTTAIYLDTTFTLSHRKPILFDCKADSACLDGRFLVVFNHELVEIHDVVNGTLRQVISGSGIECLTANSGCHRYQDNPNAFYSRGRAPLREGEGRRSQSQTVKFAMQNPKYEDCQIILELLLNQDAEEIN